jgi:elongation factor G
LTGASPVLLEPIGALKICVPDNYVGDVMGDLPKRRGRVLGIDPIEDGRGTQAVIAEDPMAEMADYVIALRAMTQGRGKFDMEFVRYEEVPGPIAEKIIAEAKKDA